MLGWLSHVHTSGRIAAARSERGSSSAQAGFLAAAVTLGVTVGAGALFGNVAALFEHATTLLNH